LGNGEQRLTVESVHTNGLEVRFEEHRRIVAIEGDALRFEVVFGKRAGCFGACKVASFWLWTRGEVAK
jgi:hypothetical protein